MTDAGALSEAEREYESLCDRFNDQSVLLAKVKAENERLRALLREAIHELDPPGYYGPGSLWARMTEAGFHPRTGVEHSPERGG